MRELKPIGVDSFVVIQCERGNLWPGYLDHGTNGVRIYICQLGIYVKKMSALVISKIWRNCWSSCREVWKSIVVPIRC
jgi:hypothetical protein